ncbi:YjbH domain-containing protein [Thaumasiovibrio sp. DFM-14]|uniref:YjbH domain-containing protein n=1 Tax=Thaumasiovibrio sp. DFM-14 TaxID=3384792 RepID=UPI0039A27274
MARLPSFSARGLAFGVAIASGCVISSSAWAQIDTFISNQSFTGLVFTPNAQVTEYGNFNYSFGQGVPFYRSQNGSGIREWDNWVGALGFFPGAEGVGRVVVKGNYTCNQYVEPNCPGRDLSASMKVQLPFIYDFTGIHVAAGMQDIGGAANNFDVKYIVADKTFEFLPLRVSAGYGQSNFGSGVMHGAFGGIELQPLPFAQFVGEYDAVEANAAVRLFTPQGYLPFDAQLGAQYQVYSSHEKDLDIWNINASIPLIGRDKNKRIAQNSLELTQEERLAIELDKASVSNRQSMLQALLDEGFLNVRLGQRDADNDNPVTVIELEDRRYNHNKADALGVALGIVASHLEGNGNGQADIAVSLLENGIAMIEAETNASCYREFLSSGVPCSVTQFVNASYANGETEWELARQASGFGRVQVVLAPSLYHTLATEYGFFDYSLALASNVYVPLWRGASLDVRHLLPLANSDDYDDGRIWGKNRHESQVDRILLNQTFGLPHNIYTQFSVGHAFGSYNGWLNETVWNSPQGMHTLGWQYSEWKPEDRTDDYGRFRPVRETQLATYTLNLPAFNWQGQVEAGKYFGQDEGYSLYSHHWVGDTKITARYLNSKAKGSDLAEEFLSIGVTIPLTLNRDMKPGYVQVRGSDEFEYAIQTRINAKTHNNLNSGLGNRVRMQNRIERRYLNRNRMSPAYFEQNEQRLRNAYLRYLDVRG